MSNPFLKIARMLDDKQQVVLVEINNGNVYCAINSGYNKTKEFIVHPTHWTAIEAAWMHLLKDADFCSQITEIKIMGNMEYSALKNMTKTVHENPP